MNTRQSFPLLAFAALLCCLMNSSAVRAADFNGDGMVNDEDLQVFTSVLVGRVQDPQYLQTADVNQDGVADARDIASFMSLSMVSRPRGGLEGACCLDLPDAPDSCLVLGELECAEAGGQYQGDETDCNDPATSCGNPPSPTVACCLDDVCADLTFFDCLMQGGHPQPPFSSCDQATCAGDPPAGACCRGFFGVSHCCETTEQHCALFGGDYQGDGVGCDDPDIACARPTRACCLPDGSCQEATFFDCLHDGGIPSGPDTTCGEAECVALPPEGACCVDHFPFVNCLTVSEAECADLDGGYQGDGTSCFGGDVDCRPTVACCLSDGACVEDNFMDCLIAGGIPSGPDTTCGDVECEPLPPEGACCVNHPFANCLQLTADECAGHAGAYQGDGTACNDPSVDCTPPAPTTACCLPDGDCVDAGFFDCLHQGGAPSGPGTSCAAVECVPLPPEGACCVNWFFVNCLQATTEECADFQGSYQGDGTSCWDSQVNCEP